MSVRVLITGATGFVGRHIVYACRARGNAVGALVVPGDGVTLPEGIEIFRGTLEQPPWDAIETFAPRVCVHAAWVTTPGAYMTSPLNMAFEAWSRTFLARLLDKSVRRVVGVGSCAEYLPEGSETAEAPYVQCKKRMRAFLMRETRARGASGVWGRVFFPFGAGEPPGKLCRGMVEAVWRGERFRVRSPDAMRDYIAVEDVARGLAMLADGAVEGDVDIGSGAPITVRTLAECVATVMGREPDDCFEWGHQPDNMVLPAADTARLRELGWTPTVSLRQGIERLAASLREEEKNDG